MACLLLDICKFIFAVLTVIVSLAVVFARQIAYLIERYEHN